MLSFRQLIMIYATIQIFQSDMKYIRWLSNPVLLSLDIIYFITEVLIQLLIAYKFPLLFVSWLIITDAFYHRLLTIIVTIFNKFTRND